MRVEAELELQVAQRGAGLIAGHRPPPASRMRQPHARQEDPLGEAVEQSHGHLGVATVRTAGRSAQEAHHERKVRGKHLPVHGTRSRA